MTTDILTVPHAFMRPFKDVGDGKLRTNSRQFSPVYWGSDPFLIEVDGRFWIYSTYGPTLPPWPSGVRRGSPGIYAFSRDELGLGEPDKDPWEFEGVVLRPWGSSPLRPPEFHDSEGVETFTVVPLGDYLIGMYHGYDSTIRRPATINHCYLALAHADDPSNWMKIQPVISEEQARAADPRLSLVTAVGEPSLQWDAENQICIGTMGIKGFHSSATPPDITNPLGGMAGECWRTHVIASRDFVNWWISAPVIIPPTSFQTRPKGCSQTSHSACVLDPRSPRILHVFTTWGGGYGTPHPHNPKGIRHWAALYDESWPMVFHPNPHGAPDDDGRPTNSVRPRNEDPVSEDGGHIGGPAPLLRFADDSTDKAPQWSMVYHAENKWRAENGTPAEKAAIAALETRGRRHQRLAVEGIAD